MKTEKFTTSIKKFRAKRIDIENVWEYFSLLQIANLRDMAQYYVNWTQFTGLLDSKGNEIYEGDILSEKWKALVHQHKNGAYMVKFGLSPDINEPTTLLHYLTSRKRACMDERDCTIIGNIFDNPNLI